MRIATDGNYFAHTVFCFSPMRRTVRSSTAGIPFSTVVASSAIVLASTLGERNCSPALLPDRAAHSESVDDDYHLTRGLLFLTRSLAGSELDLNDPPLGEGIIALPMLVTNLIEGRKARG